MMSIGKGSTYTVGILLTRGKESVGAVLVLLDIPVLLPWGFTVPATTPC